MNELDAIFTRYYLQLIKSIAALRNCYSRKDPYFFFFLVSLLEAAFALGRVMPSSLATRSM